MVSGERELEAVQAPTHVCRFLNVELKCEQGGGGLYTFLHTFQIACPAHFPAGALSGSSMDGRAACGRVPGMRALRQNALLME